jgi:hypothetical protein
MAVAVKVIFHDQDALENYKKSLALLGVTSGGSHPDPSCLFHWATESGGGVTVTDVWTTQEAFEAFAAGPLGSVMEEVGIAKPEIKVIDVCSFLTAGS